METAVYRSGEVGLNQPGPQRTRGGSSCISGVELVGLCQEPRFRASASAGRLESASDAISSSAR